MVGLKPAATAVAAATPARIARMRVLLERSRSARIAVLLLAVAAVLGLARAASAGGDLGFRRDTSWPEPQPALQLIDLPVPAPAPLHHRHARRIWAASRSRPLRSALAGHRPRTRVADTRRARPRLSVARLAPAPEPQIVFPKLIVLPKPPRPALVSIYQDRTLRDGDAVMMADGIHLFRGAGQWPYRPRDFVRLTFVAALDWHLRQTLDALDRNPPTRWTSMGSTAG